MKNTPLLSIVTVTFNDLRGLTETCRSIEKQVCERNEIEWIIIDGGSNDGTVPFLKTIERTSVRWISEPDRGIYDAMNKGIDRSVGRFILFLNAGDTYPHEHVLSGVFNCMKGEERNADIILGGATLIFPNKKGIYRPPRRIESYIWHGLPANHQAIYFRRQALQGVRYDLNYKICGDYFLVATLYRRGATVAYIHNEVVNFAIGGTSYLNPYLLFSEPYNIQRDVLALSYMRRVQSVFKRALSTIVVRVLNQRWISRLVCW